MRFILRNAVNNPALEANRRSHPGKVQRRPVIGGKPLPTGARRVFDRGQLTGPMLQEIAHHVEVGNITFIQVGKRGPVDMAALAEACGFTELFDAAEDAPLEAVVPTPVVEEPPSPVVDSDDSGKTVVAKVGIMQVEVTAGADGILGTDDDEVKVSSARKVAEPVPVEEPELAEETADLEEVLEEEAEEEPAEDEVVIPEDLEAYLSGLRNKELQPVLEMLGESSQGKKKSIMVDEIMFALLNDPDPVTARNAIAKAQSFREE